jgi:hypothetical protein
LFETCEVQSDTEICRSPETEGGKQYQSRQDKIFTETVTATQKEMRSSQKKLERVNLMQVRTK